MYKCISLCCVVDFHKWLVHNPHCLRLLFHFVRIFHVVLRDKCCAINDLLYGIRRFLVKISLKMYSNSSIESIVGHTSHNMTLTGDIRGSKPLNFVSVQHPRDIA